MCRGVKRVTTVLEVIYTLTKCPIFLEETEAVSQHFCAKVTKLGCLWLCGDDVADMPLLSLSGILILFSMLGVFIHSPATPTRYGRKGVAINMVTARDVGTLKELEGFYNTQCDELPMNFAEHLE